MNWYHLCKVLFIKGQFIQDNFMLVQQTARFFSSTKAFKNSPQIGHL
jgi:hypothetical protein